MKISYNWLKEYVLSKGKPIDMAVEEASKLLTDCGLEVESIEKIETIKGGLKGVVVGEVKTKEKHPDADRLSITTVDVGTGQLLNIVCGAPNVAAGQKVFVATIGAALYPISGEPFEIKKSKIRGQLSEGMICAEDEIGLGASHEGIMVLDVNAKTGSSAREYFANAKGAPKLEDDYLLEIGLTPNRADAASHIGVARDLIAVLNCKALLHHEESEAEVALSLPSVKNFKPDNDSLKIDVVVEDAVACPRYSGLTISNVKVKESPDWLKNKLKTINVRPINNIVDITNYVLHELGQPMHAFDADKIKGNRVVVKKLADKTKFITLDEKERELSSEDLMICDAEGPMCIAGVFGGRESAVTETTKNIFLESAYFNATSVRKSSKRHDLKTDASFRFERGTDPNATVYALKRAALLIKELAGGEVSSDINDIYPVKVENFKVSFSYAKAHQLIGKHIELKIIKNIFNSLEIEIEREGNDALLLSVPPFKVDVYREQDVIEEILRIYGYNNIEVPTVLHSSIQYAEKPDKEKTQSIVSDLLSNNGFSEIMSLSLTKMDYAEKLKSLTPDNSVRLLNPLSSDLNVMRQTLLFSGLETIAYNQNRKNSDLKIYEFGKTYRAVKGAEGVKYSESKHLSVFMTGYKSEESWLDAIWDFEKGKKTDGSRQVVSFYTIKGIVNAIIDRLGIKNLKTAEVENDLFSYGLSYKLNKATLVEFGAVAQPFLKSMDIKQVVFYADFNWDVIIEALKNIHVMYIEAPKFPEVRRDLALLIDKSIRFEQLEDLAYRAEKTLLKNVNVFDVYEDANNPAFRGKKSYALSFILQDNNATLTDKQIEKTMEKLIKIYQEKTGAEIR